MYNVKITVVHLSCFTDLIEKYENPIEHACSLKLGDEFISIEGKKPDGLCNEAWKALEEYVLRLAKGESNFFDGWMKDKDSAMISCNDGFRPVSFFIKKIK